MPTLRLLSVNARSRSLDRAALAALIAQAGPDVACVHGSPSLLRWRSISAALARRAGMVVVGGGRTGGGNLLMSTLGVDVLATRDLRFAGGSGLRPPGATLAVLRAHGSEFVLACARLAGTAGLEQAGELQAAIAGLVPGDPPVVISAEGSDHSGTALQALAQGRVAAHAGLFVDTRIGVAKGPAPKPGATSTPTVSVELSLPD